MIDPSQWSQLGGLLFVARRLVQGLYAGRHASTLHGRSVEFHDYRTYSPGDELHRIDWKVYGRTDRYYLRRSREFTDLRAYIMLDASRSMHFAGLDRAASSSTAVTKLHYAQALAASIAFLLVRQFDRVGLGVFNQKLIEHLPVAGGWSHLQRICRTLDEVRPGAGPGDAGVGLRQAHRQLRRGARSGGLLILISDLLDEPGPVLDALSRFRHDRFDAIVFQVLTRDELDLTHAGQRRLKMIDLETRRMLPTDLPHVQQRFGELMREHVETLRAGCAARRFDHRLVTIDQPVTAVLRDYLSRRG